MAHDLDVFREDWMREIASRKRRHTVPSPESSLAAALSVARIEDSPKRRSIGSTEEDSSGWLAAAASPPSRPSPTFMGVPPEVRNRIYEFVFDAELVATFARSDPEPATPSTHLSLLRTCTTVYNEAALLAFSLTYWSTKKFLNPHLKISLVVLPLRLSQAIRRLDLRPSVCSKDYETLSRPWDITPRVGFTDLGGRLDGLEELRITWITPSRTSDELAGTRIYREMDIDIYRVLENTMILCLAAAGQCRALRTIKLSGWEELDDNQSMRAKFGTSLMKVAMRYCDQPTSSYLDSTGVPLTGGVQSLSDVDMQRLTEKRLAITPSSHFGWNIEDVGLDRRSPIKWMTITRKVDEKSETIKIELEGDELLTQWILGEAAT